MPLEEYDADDTAAVLAAVTVLNAVRREETPWLPPVTAYRQAMRVRHSWDGTPVRHFLLREDDGDPVAVAQLELPTWDNQDFAWFYLEVHPAHRRRGHGRRVLAHLEQLAVEAGCTKIGSAGWDLPTTRAYAAALGFVRGSEEVYRVQHPQELPAGLAEDAVAEASVATADYDLLRWAGRTPPELVDQVVTLAEAINDAPMGDLEVEDEVFDPERIAAYETSTLDSGHRLYRVMARHRATGEPAGHTVVAVDTDRPELAHQHDTSVVRSHRGHRLGLLLKAEMMRWLAVEEPAIEQLDTWNAEVNDHMIAVNERLGYRALGRELEFQKRLPAG